MANLLFTANHGSYEVLSGTTFAWIFRLTIRDSFKCYATKEFSFFFPPKSCGGWWLARNPECTFRKKYVLFSLSSSASNSRNWARPTSQRMRSQFVEQTKIGERENIVKTRNKLMSKTLNTRGSRCKKAANTMILINTLASTFRKLTDGWHNFQTVHRLSHKQWFFIHRTDARLWRGGHPLLQHPVRICEHLNFMKQSVSFPSYIAQLFIQVGDFVS